LSTAAIPVATRTRSIVLITGERNLGVALTCSSETGTTGVLSGDWNNSQEVWADLKKKRGEDDLKLSFDWFVLTLDLLFSIDAVELKYK
jgi:hypothetical protein